MISSLHVAIVALIFFTIAATVVGRPFALPVQQRRYLENWDDCEASSVDCAPEYEQYRRQAARHLPRPVNPVVVIEEHEEDFEEIDDFWQDGSDANDHGVVMRHGFHPLINDKPEFE